MLRGGFLDLYSFFEILVRFFRFIEAGKTDSIISIGVPCFDIILAENDFIELDSDFVQFDSLFGVIIRVRDIA